MKTQWNFLDQYRGKLFHGEWPTIPEMFNITLERFPERKCFTQFEPEPLSLSYREVGERISRVKNHILGKGIRKGDKVALTGKNSVEWAIAYISALSSGAVIVPLDYQLKPEEIERLLRFADARLLLVDEEKYDSFDEKSLKLLDKIDHIGIQRCCLVLGCFCLCEGLILCICIPRN